MIWLGLRKKGLSSEAAPQTGRYMRNNNFTAWDEAMLDA
jgi:hypothetical protein